MAGEKKEKGESNPTFLQNCLSFFTSDDAIFESVKKGDLQKINKLIKGKVPIDKSPLGYTPLLVAYNAKTKGNSNMYDIIIALLQADANPNAAYDFSEYGLGQDKGTVIQHVVETGNKNDISIMVFYGGNPVLGENTPPEVRTLVETVRRRHEQRHKLEEELKNNKSLTTDQQEKIYSDLANIWEAQEREETQPNYKQHYADTAAKWRQKINNRPVASI